MMFCLTIKFTFNAVWADKALVITLHYKMRKEKFSVDHPIVLDDINLFLTGAGRGVP